MDYQCPGKCKISKLSPELRRLVDGLIADRTNPQMILASLDSKSPGHGINYQNLYRHSLHSHIEKIEPAAPQVSESRQALVTVLKLVDPLKKIQTHEEFNKAVQILDRDIESLASLPLETRTPFQNRHLLQAMAEKRLWVDLRLRMPVLIEREQKTTEMTAVNEAIRKLKGELEDE